MKQFNGHRSWNAWNVSLWISNDFYIYMFAMECLTKPVVRNGKTIKPTLTIAVKRFLSEFSGQKTPDGAEYNRLSVRLALEGLMED